ncbi:MAG: hypothetical protein M1160_03135 [Candidatus Marsarchaeota archaeon]|jgi:hypothetical protein|nr:hypothetical protein [Candidatus Marsarchaeota archaeon]MCL5111843.1 hypothetical protein [Candidatus Marsarchaeota archaeon]
MIDSIQFVHCAIPDMALSEADTAYRLSEGFTLPCPMAVQASSESDAVQLSGSGAMPSVFQKSVFVGGKLAGRLQSSQTVEVEDGLDAARAIRLLGNSVLPCIKRTDADKAGMLIRQLRIAMFLTNSINIGALSQAPIYRFK